MNDRLYRSRSDRMLAGVAGGLAEMWDADPSLVRIIWAMLVILTGGIALVVYIVMAIIVPEEEDVWPAAAAPPAAAPPPGAASPAGDPMGAGAPAAATGQPLVTPAPEPGAMWVSPPVPSHHAARIEARAQRRAARAQRRAAGGVSGVMIGGIVLVVIGVFFLAREWLPQIDFDWFWPAMLIVLGVVLLVTAVGRKPKDPETPA